MIRNFWPLLLPGLLVTFSCTHVPRAAAPSAPPVTDAIVAAPVERPPAAATKAAIPLEDFFRNPTVAGYQVSADGQMLAVFKPYRKRMNIFVHAVNEDATHARQLTYVEDRDLTKMRWKGSEYLIFNKDLGGDENDHVFAVNVKTGVLRDLTPFKGVKARVVDDLAESSASDILLEHNDRRKETFDLYRVNVDTGAAKLLVSNDYKIKFWLVDHAGRVRGGSAYDGVSTVLYWERTPGREFEPILNTDFRNTFKPLALSADNHHIFALTNLDRDLEALVEVDPRQSGRRFVVRTVFTHPNYDLSDGEYSRARKTMGHVSLVTDRRENVFLDPADQREWEGLKAQFPRESLLRTNASTDERVWILKTFSDRSFGHFYVYDRNDHSLRDLGAVAPWLEEARMSPMQTIHFVARDGLKIEGYLTVPSGREPVGLPVILNPHGGPWTRDEWGFQPEVQFLASRGYAVLRLNFRGSTGYGRKFWEASFKQWGGKMQNDLTDGVHWLNKQGIAHPKRICIYGGSYGGYAALAGIAFTPNLYACAVDYVGMSNIFTYLKTIPPYWKPYDDMFDLMVGDPLRDKDLLESVSPVLHADRIKAPLFIAQGANDPRVSKAESDQMVEALHKRGVEVQYMVKNDEGHGFRNEENRFDFYRAMEKFLAKHLKIRE